MVSTIKIYLLFIGICCSLPLAAQQKMSLSDCLKYAIENSHKTKQAQLDIDNNELVLKEKKSAAKPQINADLNYQYAFSLREQFLNGNFGTVNDQTVAARIGQNNSLMTGVMVEQQVFSPAIFAGLELAKTSQELFQLLLNRAEEEIIYDVAEQYYGILKNQELRKALDANFERLDGLVRILKLQEENDFIKKSDVESVRIKVTELESKKLQLEGGIATQKMALKLLMGMDLNTEITLEEVIVPAPAAVDTTAPNKENFIVFQLLDKQKKVEEQQQKITKLSHLPKVSAFGYLGFQFQDNNFGAFQKEPWNTNAYIGLAVEAPIFDGGKRNAKAQQNAVKIQKIENDYAGAEQLMQFEYQRNLADLETQEKLLQLQQERIALLKDLYNQVLLQYKENTSSLLELLNAEADLRTAEVEYSTQLFDFQQVVLKLIKAQGKLKGLIK